MRINDLAFMEMDEMLSRLFDKKDYLYTAMPNNQLAVIIRWRQGQHEELCLLIKKLVDKLEDMTDHLYFAGVSRWTEGFGSLCQAYAEVMKTLRLREAAATEQVFYAGKMRTRASTPRLREEKKAMLCESIRQGNLSGAVSCFDGMFPEGGDAGPVRLTLLDVRDSLVCLYGAVVETLSQIEGVIPPAFDLINTLTLNSYQALRIHFRQYVCEAAQAAEVSSEDMDVQYRKKLEYAIASIPVEELSLERVAETLNVTPTHFSHMFRKYTGGKFIDYMTELRLRRAEELLSNTTLPVTEIAIRVGWAKTSYFNQRFKQHYGVTPGQYRRMHGGEEE